MSLQSTESHKYKVPQKVTSVIGEGVKLGKVLTNLNKPLIPDIIMGSM